MTIPSAQVRPAAERHKQIASGNNSEAEFR